MSNKNEKFNFISKNDYSLDIETQVTSFMGESIELPKNETIIERTEIPTKDDLSIPEYNNWVFEELNRCKNGYGEMSGKMYFYFNYAKIQNLGHGSISPEFRVCDSEWFNLIEECYKSEKYGIVCVKRRRGGFSWKEASDVVHDMIFNRFYHVGMNSKTDKDSEHLFDKIVFIYSNLPSFMKIKIGRKNGMHIEFFNKKKQEDGSFKKTGNQSSIVVVPPTDSAYEGRMLNKWVCDEAGKISNLPQLWSFTEDCLMQETKRIGMPILFGTSGEVDRSGKGLMHMWDKSENYDLKRFFFAGWMGLAVDEFGNDQKEEAIRWILYNRKRKEKISSKDYNDFLQKYPLTPDEAFSQARGGLGDVIKINAQRAYLRENNQIVSEGTMTHNTEDGSPLFIPQRFGDVKIYEHPIPGKKYVAGCDPADHDDAEAGASNLSLHIMSMPDGLCPPKIVMEYVERPRKLADYYEKASLILSYYNNTKVLVENNRIRMIDYFKENGYYKLLELSPPPINGIFKVKTNKIGIRMTEDVKKYMESLIAEYIDDFCDYIPSIDLLKEFGDYRSSNTDRVMSFGISLILLKERAKYKPAVEGYLKSKLPTSTIVKNNGFISRHVSDDKNFLHGIPGRSNRSKRYGF